MSYIMRNGVLYDTSISTDGNYSLGDVHDIPAEDVIASEARAHRVTTDFYSGNNTNVSMEETYNQIVLTCNVEDIDTVVSSPFEDEDMYSNFTNKQHYCTEYASFGEGKDAANAFLKIVKNQGSDYNAYEIHDWYIQQMKNHKWKFNTDDWQYTNNTNQCYVPRMMYSTMGANLCSLFKLGSLKRTTGGSDNALHNNMSMDTYLVFSVAGGGVDSGSPKASTLINNGPAATYTGNVANGRFSPTDSITTNYFVIKGKVAFAPKVYVTKNWKALQSINDRKDIWHACVHLDDNKNGDGAYYTTVHYNNNSPLDNYDQVHYSADGSRAQSMLTPWNKDWKSLGTSEASYTHVTYRKSDGDIDRISYVPVLVCEMKIGDKYLVDFFDGYSNFPTHKWLKMEDCPTYKDAAGNTRKRHWFTVGINPAFGDPLIAKQYDIVNTISPSLNIPDEEGLAIPIKDTDKLSGKIDFKIMGLAPIYNEEGIEYYYHNDWGNFWTGYTEVWITIRKNLLHELVDSVWIKDFEVKIVTDNGGIENTSDDKDLVYTSAENPSGKYINKKDDIEFNISTQLTTAEALDKGMTNTVKLNNPSLVDTNEALRSVYCKPTNESGKPEEHYISHYWQEYKDPKLLMTTEFKDTPIRSWTSHYTFDHLPGKSFFVQAENYNVKYCKRELVLKQQ